MRAYKAVNGSVRLLFKATTLRLSVLNGCLDQAAVAGFSSSGQDQRRVCGSILASVSIYRENDVDKDNLRLVNIDSCIDASMSVEEIMFRKQAHIRNRPSQKRRRCQFA